MDEPELQQQLEQARWEKLMDGLAVEAMAFYNSLIEKGAGEPLARELTEEFNRQWWVRWFNLMDRPRAK